MRTRTKIALTAVALLCALAARESAAEPEIGLSRMNLGWGGWVLCMPDVLVTHSPVVARASETVTFNAEVKGDCRRPVTVDIIVNGSVVRTCDGLRKGDLCTYTGGPYPDYENWVVGYKARVTDDWGRTHDSALCQFGITSENYRFRPLGYEFQWIPARMMGSTRDKFDFAFHRGTDYANFADFVSDASSKINDVYAQQEVINISRDFESFNFYVYKKTAVGEGVSGRSCVTEVHADADADMPWRETDAILHTASLTDCTSFSPSPPHLSAEGSNTKAFLHESGHAVFDLADEYDDSGRACLTYYFESATEPNIFSSRARCEAEQNRKGRDPAACWEFTTCQDGWWGIHDLDDNTVMINGMVGNPWGIEGDEHVWRYFFPLP